MVKHKSAQGGIHAVVRRHESRETVSMVSKDRLLPGKQLRNVCVHHVGGSSSATLTLARKQKVLREHRANRPGPNGKCALHVKNWKAKCVCGAV
jgi:hypothetical protein